MPETNGGPRSHGHLWSRYILPGFICGSAFPALVMVAGHLIFHIESALDLILRLDIMGVYAITGLAGALVGGVYGRRSRQRDQARRGMHEVEAKFKAFTQESALGYFEMDLEGTLTFANQQAADIIGRDMAELNQLNFRHFIHPEDRERAAENLSLIITEPDLPPREYRLIHNDGHTVYVTVASLPLRKDGRLAGFMGTITDETPRRMAEAGRIESEEKFRSLTNESAYGYFEVAIDGRIMHVNEQGAGISGYTVDEMLSMNFRDLIIDEDMARAGEDFQKAITLPNAGPKDYRVHHKDGGRRYVEINSLPLKREGEIVGLMGTVLDTTDRMMMAEELKASEEKYRTIFEKMMDVYYRSDLEGRLQMITPSGAKLLGYDTVEEMIGKNIAADFYLDAGDRTAFLAELDRTGEVRNYETVSRGKDGTAITVSANSHYVYDDQGRPMAVEGVFRDITAHKQADEDLAASEERFRGIAERSFDMIYEVGLDGTILYVSPAVERILGYTPEELRAAEYGKLVDPDLLPEAERMTRSLYEGKDLEGAVFPAFAKDGREVWFEINASPVYRAGELSHFQGVCTDITERRLSEQALRSSEERFRRLFEQSNDAIFIHDMHGKLIEVNSRACEMLGYDRDKLVGMLINDLHPAEEEENVRKAVETTILKESVRFDSRFTCADGHIIEVEISSRIVDEAKGLIQGIVRDVTERKRAADRRQELEARLHRSQKMEALGTLAGGVAHDLNNILGGLVSYPDLLLQNLPGDSPIREAVETIQKTGQAAVSVVQDLLSLARRGVAVTEAIDLNDIVREYLASLSFEELTQTHPLVKVVSHLTEAPASVIGSPASLSKTVMNLVLNAAEAMPEGGLITIATDVKILSSPFAGYEQISPGEYVVLQVADSGIGISAQDMERIFEPFYTKKAMGRSGTGLGMAVVWGTVKDMRGSVDVCSAEDKGTTMELYLPKADICILERPAEDSSEGYEGRGETILVVDDYVEQRELISLMLTSLGYEVATVASGEDAINWLGQRGVDLVILDMLMDPGINGLETYRRILEIHPGQKAIIGSGYSDTDDVREVQSLGAGVALRKPYTVAKLGRAVREELDR